jgi:hypothetical protein
MEARDITVTLELRCTGDALAGRARDEHGAERRFSGWLGLVAAIDELVGETDPASDRSRVLATTDGRASTSVSPTQEEGSR